MIMVDGKGNVLSRLPPHHLALNANDLDYKFCRNSFGSISPSLIKNMSRAMTIRHSAAHHITGAEYVLRINRLFFFFSDS